MTHGLDSWREGDAVKGVYCGVPFTGNLAGGEFGSRNAPDYRAFIFVVSLAKPIEVFGQERTRIEVWSNSETNLIEAA